MKSLILAIATMFVVTSCGSIKELTNAIMSMKDMQFRIVRVENMKVAGVNTAKMGSTEDITPTDVMRLLEAYHSKNIKATFTVMLEAKNPNDGSVAGSKPMDLTLKELPWTLFVDDRNVISGNIQNEVSLAGGGTSAPFPIQVSMDVSKVFYDKGYEEIMKALLSIGGVNGTPATIKLKARPTVSTPYGIMKSPNDITIVATEFTGR